MKKLLISPPSVKLSNKVKKIVMAKSVRSELFQIFKSSVNAVLPENLIKNCISYSPITQQMILSDEKYDLRNKYIYVIGTGKAAQNMAIEVDKILGSKIKKGIISIPNGNINKSLAKANMLFYEGAKNNLPDKDAMATAIKVQDLVTNLGKDDFLLVLISGGGSALLPLPKEPISLEEKTLLIKHLAHSGADITELNTVRKKISGLKGGQLAIKSKCDQTIALILSDIVGDPLDLIASGPTTENNDHPLDALNVIKKYRLTDKLPQSILEVLNKTDNMQTFPKDKVKNLIIGSNKICTKAAYYEAMGLNYTAIELSNIVTGNVEQVANEYTRLTKAFCDFLNKKIDKIMLKNVIGELGIPGLSIDFIETLNETSYSSDFCLILGGEITVQVNGTGKGGRNQQLALEFSNSLHNIKRDLNDFTIYFLSAGTDGIDGPTDAAGAIGYLDLISDSQKENLDVNLYLKNNDSYNFYRNFKNGALHVMTGHTNTNVMDIHLIFIKRQK